MSWCTGNGFELREAMAWEVFAMLVEICSSRIWICAESGRKFVKEVATEMTVQVGQSCEPCKVSHVFDECFPTRFGDAQWPKFCLIDTKDCTLSHAEARPTASLQQFLVTTHSFIPR